MPSTYVKQKDFRDESCCLKVVIVGAGLGGLGAAISCLLAGHEVLVLEAADELGEVGAGIQCLPNSSRVLNHWGLRPALEKHMTRPRLCIFNRWKGGIISYMDFRKSESQFPGGWYADFHRASLQKCLVDRVVELGGVIRCSSKVTGVVVSENGTTATAVMENGSKVVADLLVGADGVFGKLNEILIGRPDPPIKTGDLAYRLLLPTEEMLKDPDLAGFVTEPQVNYWMGPGAHAVNYILRGGELFNMVLLVPDDIPENSSSTVEGDVKEMCDAFKGWDPRIEKLLKLCKSVYKWRLCIRISHDNWTHPSGSWTMLGDAVHATLPYLASGAGMSFEDGAVLGECLSRLPKNLSKDDPSFLAAKRHALAVYEACRKERTRMVVERSNLQQYLYHLPDGPEQEERDRRMRMNPTPEGEALAWRDPGLAPKLLGYDHIDDVNSRWSDPSVSSPSSSARRSQEEGDPPKKESRL